MDGWLIIDKPTGMSSAHVVAKVRRHLKIKKIGHAGTLDPLASGVLPLALGEATKTASYAMSEEKEYLFTVTWGEERSTDDAEGDILSQSALRPTLQQIQDLLPLFHGTLQQVPPIFSAIQKDGKRAYALARQGQEVTLEAREVLVKSLETIDSSSIDSTAFKLICGKGTYVRSIARDLGRKLGCGGYVSELKRTKVGSFYIDHAISLDSFLNLRHKSELEQHCLPIEKVLDDIPALLLGDEDVQRLRLGQRIRIESSQEGIHLCLDKRRQPIGLVTLQEGVVHPKRIFNLETNGVI